MPKKPTNKNSSVSNFKEILSILKELKKNYSSYSLGKHFATALDEYYPDIWGISDKEMLYALTKYKAQMEMDVAHETGKDELDEILKGGLDLYDGIQQYEEDDREDLI